MCAASPSGEVPPRALARSLPRTSAASSRPRRTSGRPRGSGRRRGRKTIPKHGSRAFFHFCQICQIWQKRSFCKHFCNRFLEARKRVGSLGLCVLCFVLFQTGRGALACTALELLLAGSGCFQPSPLVQSAVSAETPIWGASESPLDLALLRLFSNLASVDSYFLILTRVSDNLCLLRG